MASFSQETVNALQLAVDEACANVIEHAYQGDESNTIDIDIVLKSDRVTVRIRDEGEPFLDTECRLPDIFEYAALKRSGGFGVHLIRTLADSVEYSTRGRSNVCSVTMYRNDGAKSALGSANINASAGGTAKPANPTVAKPGAASKPGAAPKPGAASQPGGTPKPGGAPKPGGPGKPGRDQRPGPPTHPTKRSGKQTAPPPATKKTVRRKKG
jgi:anti-sigma regulatory factor (Ser/Thr protein kinase)